jgi:hypothetical protein
MVRSGPVISNSRRWIQVDTKWIAKVGGWPRVRWVFAQKNGRRVDVHAICRELNCIASTEAHPHREIARLAADMPYMLNIDVFFHEVDVDDVFS